MSKNIRITLGIVIVLAIIVGIIASLRSQPAEAPDLATEEPIDFNEDKITIPVKHQYKDGEHRFIGTLELPSPCHSYSAEIEDGVVPNIALTISDPAEGQMCGQVIVDRTFDVRHVSPRETIFTASLNNEPVILNIFEVAADENIETIDLYLKG